MAKEAELLKRITLDPKVLAGKPTIRGLRISVEQILKALAARALGLALRRQAGGSAHHSALPLYSTCHIEPSIMTHERL